MRFKRVVFGTVLGVAVWTVPASERPSAQAQGRLTLTVTSDTLVELRQWDTTVNEMIQADRLRLARAREDALVPGRVHERFDQYYNGVRVFGGDIVVELDRGQTVSIFGDFHLGIDLDPRPGLSLAEAREAGERLSGGGLLEADPELVILPKDDGTYALTYRARIVRDAGVRMYFIDAGTGAVVMDYDDVKTQAPNVGRARGVLNDEKKISVVSTGGLFLAIDGLRPPDIVTFDMQGQLTTTVLFLTNRLSLAELDAGFIATSTTNTWTEGAVVDAQVYAGFTYDYFFKRHNRQGLDNRNITIRSLVNPVRRTAVDVERYAETFPEFFVNAGYYGNGYMVYGVGTPPGFTFRGQTWNQTSGAFDIVAHELTHGVTEFTSNLIYRNESGALNEAFSDCMAVGVEFFFQPPGGGLLEADYLLGEDVIRGPRNGIRSMADPQAYNQPDHYSRRFRGTADNGGVHINSGIANHAFYLAIEGGTNRTSGLAVQGAGGVNREQIERVFYHAFTNLPSNAGFSLARARTLESARGLYGAGSVAERAIAEAWTAVGVR